MKKKLNLIEARFGKLVIKEELSVKKYKGGGVSRRFNCLCDCGNYTIVCYNNLKNTNSCGCLAYHGLTNTIEYRIWHRIKDVCYNKNSKDYKNYGGRGIRIFKEWYSDFIAFYNWIQQNLGSKPSFNHSLERKDNNGHYVPSNLKWATKSEQNKNRRGHKVIIYHYYFTLCNDYY